MIDREQLALNWPKFRIFENMQKVRTFPNNLDLSFSLGSNIFNLEEEIFCFVPLKFNHFSG